MTDHFDPLGMMRGCTTVFANAAPTKTFDIESLKKIVANLEVSEPQEWLLISPQGVMTTGTNPMKLAAMAMPREVSYLSPLEMKA